MLFDCAFCSYLNINNWLQNHLLTCPFKYLTGIDCPGCGFQRSVLALLQGDFGKSFALYPATIPLLLAVLWWGADSYAKLDDANGTVKKSLFIITATIVVVSYTLKMTHLHLL